MNEEELLDKFRELEREYNKGTIRDSRVISLMLNFRHRMEEMINSCENCNYFHEEIINGFNVLYCGERIITIINGSLPDIISRPSWCVKGDKK